MPCRGFVDYSLKLYLQELNFSVRKTKLKIQRIKILGSDLICSFDICYLFSIHCYCCDDELLLHVVNCILLICYVYRSLFFSQLLYPLPTYIGKIDKVLDSSDPNCMPLKPCLDVKYKIIQDDLWCRYVVIKLFFFKNVSGFNLKRSTEVICRTVQIKIKKSKNCSVLEFAHSFLWTHFVRLLLLLHQAWLTLLKIKIWTINLKFCENANNFATFNIPFCEEFYFPQIDGAPKKHDFITQCKRKRLAFLMPL